jgi:hypothetical protein
VPNAAKVAAGQRDGGHPSIFHGWRIVAAFAVTQPVGYGVLYYAFAALGDGHAGFGGRAEET